MNKWLLIIFFLSWLVIFNSCTKTSSRSTALTTTDEIYDIQLRLSKLEADSLWQAKQIRFLYVRDSLKNISISSLTGVVNDIRNRFVRDSIYQWIAINNKISITRFSKDSSNQWLAIKSVTPLIQSVKSLATRFYKDSTNQWASIKKLQAVIIPDIRPLTIRFIKDSITQWVAIKKLQSASPITQIPIIQAQIKTMQSKDLAQDKNIIANLSLIVSLGDSVKVLKVYVGDDTDISLDSSGRVIISKLGMDRIRSEMKQ